MREYFITAKLEIADRYSIIRFHLTGDTKQYPYQMSYMESVRRGVVKKGVGDCIVYDNDDQYVMIVKLKDWNEACKLLEDAYVHGWHFIKRVTLGTRRIYDKLCRSNSTMRQVREDHSNGGEFQQDSQRHRKTNRREKGVSRRKRAAIVSEVRPDYVWRENQ